MRTAVCPGSFDPITKGHLDIIERSAKLFDEVTVLVLSNPDKKCSFTVEERMDLIRRVTTHLPNVSVGTYQGLLADYVREHGTSAIIKGLRAVSDFEYEFQMALTNKQLNPDFETMFLTTNKDHLYLSSSVVKQIAMLDGDISLFIPAEILSDIMQRLCNNGGNNNGN